MINLPPSNSNGSCTLVGAGPGDPELITIKAMKAIQKASLILVDDLVNDAILDFATPAARIIYVGKRGGCKSTPQAFIHKLMLNAVQEGEHVVRLKGGDPFIFGRGGEEIKYLHQAGIKVEVINGITAGLAAPSALGLPLTHRAYAHGLVFITGHTPAETPINWQNLASTAHQARLTLVIYMGMRNAQKIQADLLVGLPAQTPVAIIQNASLPQQRHAITRLYQLCATIENQQLASPSIIVVGDVVHGMTALSSAESHNVATASAA